jgi:uncharacterized protein (DUF488 family)
MRSRSLKTEQTASQGMKLVTMGVYGFDQECFFAALKAAGVDTFCDIRWRRGVRGAEYAFVNSQRLQQRLAELHIRYLYFRELAPAPDLRQRQAEADRTTGTAKRQRTCLGEVFRQGYRAQNLGSFNCREFITQLGDAHTVALFCVEREPAACHRSLLAERLQQELGLEVNHLMPEGQAP